VAPTKIVRIFMLHRKEQGTYLGDELQ